MVTHKKNCARVRVSSIDSQCTCRPKEIAPPPYMTAEQEREFVRLAYENFPEAAQCFGVESFHYGSAKDPARFRFVFVDYEDNSKRHVVTEADAIRGLRVFAGLVNAGKLKGLGLPANFLSPASSWTATRFGAGTGARLSSDAIR